MIAYRTDIQGKLMRAPALAAMALALVVAASPMAAMAAQDNTDARLRKVETEVRALQRKVFPGGDGTFFEPQITAPATAPAAPATVPGSTPVTDLLSRMDAVEAQMARLTSQVEQNTNRLNQLEEKVAAGLAPAPAPAPQGAPDAPAAQPTSTLGVIGGGVASPPATRPAPAPAPVATAAPAKPPVSAPAPASSTRVAGVEAIEKPQTGDAGEDEYTYGFRLWEAGYFPEARQQLKTYLEKFPNHRMASYGRNLLGRAWLDDKNPSEAAKWFLQNYQADKQGARAADSLLYLAISMKQLKDSKRACIALAEFSRTYAAEAAGRLGSLYASTRSGLDCR